jgi:hypothetical protein
MSVIKEVWSLEKKREKGKTECFYLCTVNSESQVGRGGIQKDVGFDFVF